MVPGWSALVLTVASGFFGPIRAQSEWPQTRAESSAYRETSRYADVMAFLGALVDKGAPMRLEVIGRSTEGRDIPLAICAKHSGETPRSARQKGLIVAYVQANIHAGEVEGKESALMLLREIAQRGPAGRLLDRMVLLIAPIYNIDGNEQFGPVARNRPSQDGPEEVGVRANGQGLDLNRDCMKAESPEMRAVLEHVYVKWDPDVVMDLHTTNGTRHGFVLTYSPPLNPTTDEGILAFTRDELLPKVRREFPRRHGGWQIFDYGNVSGQGENRRWATFEELPRYVTNYVGVRNRVAVLSEAASFQPFKVRVESTLAFVRDVLTACAERKDRIRELVKAADLRMREASEKSADIGVRFEMASRGSEAIPLEKTNPDHPVARNRAPTHFETVTMPVYDRFRATRTSKLPKAYLIPPEFPQVVQLLMRHGIAVERTSDDAPAQPLLQFAISEATVGRQPFQGRRLLTLEGKWEPVSRTVFAGSYKVHTSQPLGLLAFHLLEPESLDGVAAWGLLGESFEVGRAFPIAKIME